MKNAFKIKTHFLLVWCFLISYSYVNAQNADIDVLRNINLHRNESLDPSFKLISNSVAPLSIGAPLVIYGIGFIKKDSSLKQKGIYMGETLLVVTFMSTALKKVVRRDRPFITYPDIENVAEVGSYSFPSGHTANAFATATSISMAFPKWYVIAPSFIWAGSVGYSRMHLGVHYPSDVMAGAFVGAGSAYLTYKINEWLHKKHKRNGAK